MNLPKNEQQGKGFAITLVSIVVVVLVIVIVSKVFKGVDGILEGIGLKDDKEETADKNYIEQKTTAEQNKATLSAWNPNYWRNYTGASLFTQALTDSLVLQLWSSVGYLYDTPSNGVAVIKRCTTKTQVSWIAYNFDLKYKLDLLTWLKSKYDTADQREALSSMLRHVDSLPTYKK